MPGDSCWSVSVVQVQKEDSSNDIVTYTVSALDIQRYILSTSAWIFGDYRQNHSGSTHIYSLFVLIFFSIHFFSIVAKQWYVLVSINTCRLLSSSSICVIKAKHFREYHSQSTHIRCILCLKWPLISTITEERKNNGKQTIYTLRRQFNIMVFHLCGDIPSCFI